MNISRLTQYFYPRAQTQTSNMENYSALEEGLKLNGNNEILTEKRDSNETELFRFPEVPMIAFNRSEITESESQPSLPTLCTRKTTTDLLKMSAMLSSAYTFAVCVGQISTAINQPSMHSENTAALVVPLVVSFSLCTMSYFSAKGIRFTTCARSKEIEKIHDNAAALEQIKNKITELKGKIFNPGDLKTLKTIEEEYKNFESNYTCAMTQEVLTVPVNVISTKSNYSFSGIKEWIDRGETIDPLTRINFENGIPLKLNRDLQEEMLTKINELKNRLCNLEKKSI
jgi:hypothetical protein